MFTERFVKVPISVYNVKEKELTGNENYQDSWFKFLPLELAAYRPTYYDGDTIVIKACYNRLVSKVA